MDTINIIAVDYTLGFPVIGDHQGFIRKQTQNGLLEAFVKGLGYPYTLIDNADEKMILSDMQERFDPCSVVLTRDHMMTYFGLFSARYDPAGFCLIVLDQHMDIYSYQTHGDRLNKANALRFSHDNGLVKRVYIVGVRDSEEREFDDFHMMFVPDYASLFGNRKYAGMEGVVRVVPMRQIEDLEETVKGIIDEIRKDGFKTVGLDIDLDGFDSSLIRGVQFNETFPDMVRESISDFSADFISGQLLEKGLPIESIEEQVFGICRYIQERGLGLVYRGITEFEPESDSNGLTKETIGKVLRAFHDARGLDGSG